MTIITMSVKRKIGMIEETMGKLVKILESVLVENITEQITMDDGSEMFTDNDLSGSGLNDGVTGPKLSDDYSKFGDPDVTPNHVNKELVLDRHLRKIFKQMKKISGLEEYMEYVSKQSEEFYYYNSPDREKHSSVRGIVQRIPKILGAAGQQGVDRNTATTLIYTFLNNGGYGRDFSKDTLDLSPLVTYDVDADTSKDAVLHEVSWGEVFANSKEEAIQKFEENPDQWVSDSEHQDQESGDYINIENTSVTNTNKRHLTLDNLGFA